MAFGLLKKPHHQLCSVCHWLCTEVADPEEIERIRRRGLHYDEGPGIWRNRPRRVV